MTVRIGVDIGGTFTDLVCRDEHSGDAWVAKAPTTPGELEAGVVAALASIPAETVRRADLFVHGTTIGLNALLQRSGASTGLLCTSGFRDSLEIRRADRTEMYNVNWRQPQAIVPRRYRLPVRERVRADGHIVTPLHEDDVVNALRLFEQAEITAVAVSFMNSYVNPEHELAAERVLRDSGFEGDVSLSHRLSREYREYERTSTTVIDAYVRGLTSQYLRRLETALGEQEFNGEILVTRSGGGVMTAAEVEERPFEAIQSGPVAGVEGAAELCREREIHLGIAADVGGTSFDASLIIDGRPHVNYEGEVLGWPVQTPWVDVQSIGAGGGSIAYADHDLLRVGPKSADARPGPACYGRGGTQPTVTDAALILGMLAKGELSNDFHLDADAARTAIEPLAKALGMTSDVAAQGIIRVVTSSMAEVLRERTIGQGEDPREATLLAFGGAGPLFATLLADELGIERALIPEHAGNFSAFGLLGQDVTNEIARTHIRLLTPSALDEVNGHLTEMFIELASRHSGDGTWSGAEHSAGVDVRYVGQDHTLTVTLSVDPAVGIPSVAEVAQQFREQYARRFSTSLEEELEVVTIRAARRLVRDKAAAARPHLPSLGRSAQVRTEPDSSQSVHAYSFGSEQWLEFGLVARDALEPGRRPFDGPLIVIEPTTTTYVDVGFEIVLAEDGAIELSRRRVV
jgi:N-methylhydantoinase A